MSDAEDRLAVERVLAGETDCFEGLVRRWQGPLVNLAWRFCHDRQIAEDLAQEAFVRAYRGLARWRADGRFSTWLFSVALNVYRSRMRRMRIEEVPLEALAALADGRFVEVEIEAGERAELVRRAVAALPPKYRDALVLFYFHELNLDEAAATLGVPAGTLKAQLHRGREMLRRALGRVLPAAEIEGG